MGEEPVDMVIVGAGAAGLMTAISAGRAARIKPAPLRIILLDTRQKIGAKILMSGGTRCNVTNREVKPTDFQGGPGHFVKHVLEAFTPQETIHFFKKIGVELVLERTGKYFPSTNSAQTVLDALMKEAKQAGISLKTGVRVTQIKKAGDFFDLKNADGTYHVLARKVVLSTGGRSYPTTGSDGTGYDIAKSLGHTISPTFPALTPLLTPDQDWKSLSGIAFEVKLSFFKNEKKECEYQDSFLFTHFGFSGPAVLDISRHFSSAGREERPQIKANFLPQENEVSLKILFQSLKNKNPNKFIKNFLTDQFSLPDRFVETLFKKAGLNQDLTFGKYSNPDFKKLMHVLLFCPLEISGVYGYRKAEVTAGGVDLAEVKFSTLESKHVSGLYFAGEILDVDGRIGGFNFQWAWSTGAIAGRSAAGSLLS